MLRRPEGSSFSPCRRPSSSSRRSAAQRASTPCPSSPSSSLSASGPTWSSFSSPFGRTARWAPAGGRLREASAEGPCPLPCATHPTRGTRRSGGARSRPDGARRRGLAARGAYAASERREALGARCGARAPFARRVGGGRRGRRTRARCRCARGVSERGARGACAHERRATSGARVACARACHAWRDAEIARSCHVWRSRAPRAGHVRSRQPGRRVFVCCASCAFKCAGGRCSAPHVRARGAGLRSPHFACMRRRKARAVHGMGAWRAIARARVGARVAPASAGSQPRGSRVGHADGFETLKIGFLSRGITSTPWARSSIVSHWGDRGWSGGLRRARSRRPSMISSSPRAHSAP